MAQDSDLGEFELIRRFFMRGPDAGTRPAGVWSPGQSGVILGIGDDAALLELPPDTDLVAAVDTIVAGRHFPEGSDARAIGHRALAVNLSDLAAMGATPAWATLALTLPEADPAWLERFASGLLDLAEEHGVALVGGDTTRGALTVSVQLLGHVPKGAALRRSGARAGDLLVVTGTLGDAGAGLALSLAGRQTAQTATAPPAGAAAAVPAATSTTGVAWSTATPPTAAILELLQRFDYPAPRTQFGIAARGIATAAMDLSDGLVGDLPKLAQASGLAAHVLVERLPLSEAICAAAGAAQARDWALAAGDDYELLLAVPPARYADLKAAAARLNLRLTVIGDVGAGAGVTWSLNGGDFKPAVRGYDHFAQASTQITV